MTTPAQAPRAPMPQAVSSIPLLQRDDNRSYVVVGRSKGFEYRVGRCGHVVQKYAVDESAAASRGDVSDLRFGVHRDLTARRSDDARAVLDANFAGGIRASLIHCLRSVDAKNGHP